MNFCFVFLVKFTKLISWHVKEEDDSNDVSTTASDNSEQVDEQDLPTATELSAPEIQITCVTPPPALQSSETVDEIDEDEAFIDELIALHPNDEDIVVEDIEEPPAAEDDDVRSRLAALYRLLLLVFPQSLLLPSGSLVAPSFLFC